MPNRYSVEMTQYEMQAAIRGLEELGVGAQSGNKLWQSLNDNNLVKGARSAHKVLRSGLNKMRAPFPAPEEDDDT